MEIFLHQRATETRFIKVDPDRTVRHFAIACLGEGALVWLEDGKEALDPEKTLTEIGVVERCHVHVSTCKGVLVKVRFGGDSIEESFPPPTSADFILKWAASPEGFKLTDSEAAKHVLAICGTDTELDQADHIGFYADDDCSVCLDLLPRERFEG